LAGEDQTWPALGRSANPGHANTTAMFAISIESIVGNGRDTLFWTDRWLHGCCLEDLAPEVVRCVPLRLRKENSKWGTTKTTLGRQIGSTHGWLGLAEYLEFWELLSEVILSVLDDVHRWRPEPSGLFSTKLAYRNFFVGSITFGPWKKLWKSCASWKCKTFMWLPIRNRCWTADRLQKGGLPHPECCPLCDQEEQTAQHILTSCVCCYYNLLTW